jgi:hypothetical protein
MRSWDAVETETEKLIDLLRKEWNLGRSLASMKADVGEQLIRVKRALKQRRVKWLDWLSGVQEALRARGLTPLGEASVRAYMRMARFRRHHPDLAGVYLGLDPWALCAVLTLPRPALEEFARAGVPLKNGARAPISDATVQQLRWAARRARAAAKGLPPPPDPAPKAPAGDPVSQAIALLEKAGRLDESQLERMIGAVLNAAGVRVPQTTRRQIAVTLAAAGEERPEARPAPDRHALAVAETLEKLVLISASATGWIDAATRERVRHALALLCAAVARWPRRGAA